MAEVSQGPVSSLPGSGHVFPEGTMCDVHPDRLAIVRIQGETDSFGAEYNDYCKDCYEEYKRVLKEERESLRYCDWCKQEKTHVREARDYEEGMAGPVYQVCPDCIRKQNERAEQELEESDYYDDGPDNDDYEDFDIVADMSGEDANYQPISRNWRFSYNRTHKKAHYIMGSITAYVDYYHNDVEYTFKIKRFRNTKKEEILLQGNCYYFGEGLKRVEEKLVEIGWLCKE